MLATLHLQVETQQARKEVNSIENNNIKLTLIRFSSAVLKFSGKLVLFENLFFFMLDSQMLVQKSTFRMSANQLFSSV